ncbi:MAG: hypothetical protein KDC49_04400 [Saprospiraceae bacterium]|nr:hypothetical protein [Saprospiraceae bacterium]
MTKFYIVAILTLFSFAALKAQVVSCQGSSLTFTNVICLPGDPQQTSDDFLQFTVTSSGGGSSQSSILLPMSSTPMAGTNFLPSNSPVTFSVPSINCAPLVIPFTIFGPQGECSNTVTLQAPAAPIPTMDQWGIIIVFLGMSVTGLLFLRQRKTSRLIANDLD